jgi:pimeloyl-ACP methyl ester carboxylesterase
MRIQVATGCWVEYEDAGRGRPVVLLHAFPLAGAMWRPQTEALQRDCRVVVPDLRGFGGTGPFTGTPSVDQMADDVVALLDELGIRVPIVLGGLSMGGYVALAFLRKHPARLGGLILADTRAEADSTEAKANRDRMIAVAEFGTARGVIDQLLPKLLGSETLARRPAVVEEVVRIASAQPTAGIIGALQAMRDRPDSTPWLASIRVPTLVLVGSEDPVTPPATAEAMAGVIPNARLAMIQGAGHLSNLEQPEAFTAAVRAFLQTLRS